MLRIAGTNFNPCPYPRLQYCFPSFSGAIKSIKTPKEFNQESLDLLKRYLGIETSTGERLITFAKDGVHDIVTVLVKEDNKFKNLGAAKKGSKYYSDISNFLEERALKNDASSKFSMRA